MNTIPPCYSCDGQTLKQLTRSALLWLEHHYEHINQLNVFPIPDGDTGINMLLTMRSAYREIENDDSNNVGQIAKKIAHGAVMGSRGNSGTIMSQIWSGVGTSLGSAGSFDTTGAIAALREGATTAYRGVQSPVEGTILTVIREIAEEAEKLQDTGADLGTLLEKIVERGWDALKRTPEMLTILKQAGVVDAGGAGLMYLLEGMLKDLRGEIIEPPAHGSLDYSEAVPASNLAQVLDPGESEYNYDVQFILRGQGLDVGRIKSDIEAMGDSAVIAGTAEFVKVHIHVDDPGDPISYAVRLGTISDVVVENMQEQYEVFLREKTAQQKSDAPSLPTVQPGEIGVVAVAAGEGLARAFADLGVNYVIDGGQGKNPSTEEILQAVNTLNTGQVIILPNNKNIILAAQQAAKLSRNVQVKVLPTHTIPQGISAMLPYNPAGDFETVFQDMNTASDQVITVEVTTATRSVKIDGVSVKEGQVIALLNGKLSLAGDEIEPTVQTVLKDIPLEDYELVSLYYGQDVPAGSAEALGNLLQNQYDSLEFQVLPGGQAHYHYIIGVE